MNAYTPPTPADREQAALARHKHLNDALEQMIAYRDADLRYARTNRTSDLLAVIEATYKTLGALEEAFGLDFSDQRNQLEVEASDECCFNLRADGFTDDLPVENFGASHPDAGRGIVL